MPQILRLERSCSKMGRICYCIPSRLSPSKRHCNCSAPSSLFLEHSNIQLQLLETPMAPGSSEPVDDNNDQPGSDAAGYTTNQSQLRRFTRASSLA
ncbi:hypothetical protein PCASD_20925 [Puccinia coronata f. sp. avenae]|uniref:Uncharacterized protein n=1 Tax=Puccinia coronata f. sp. avenae TaxID=200324 RepID=A0A2N5SYQ9_9BASI|nr:hypothetical protein PCASD_20925 [Puccinia coronata f. sp. avenae]